MRFVQTAERLIERLFFTPFGAVLVGVTAETMNGPASLLSGVLSGMPTFWDWAIRALCFAAWGLVLFPYISAWLRGSSGAVSAHPVALRATALAAAAGVLLTLTFSAVLSSRMIEIVTGLLWAAVLFDWTGHVARKWVRPKLHWHEAIPRFVALAGLPIVGALACALAGQALWSELKLQSGAALGARWAAIAVLLLALLALSGFILSRAPVYLGNLRRTRNDRLEGYKETLLGRGAPVRKIVLAMSALEDLKEAEAFAASLPDAIGADEDLAAKMDGRFKRHSWHQPVRVLRMILGRQDKSFKVPEIVVLVAHERHNDEPREEDLAKDPEYMAFVRVLSRTLNQYLGLSDTVIRLLGAAGGSGRISIHNYDDVFSALKNELNSNNGRGTVVDITGGRSTYSAAAMVACLQTHARVAYLHMMGGVPVMNTEQVLVSDVRTAAGR